MGFLMPKLPKAQPSAQPLVPRRSDLETQAAVADQRKKFFDTEGGRGANMLTGASSFTSGFSAGTARLLGQTT